MAPLRYSLCVGDSGVGFQDGWWNRANTFSLAGRQLDLPDLTAEITAEAGRFPAEICALRNFAFSFVHSCLVMPGPLRSFCTGPRADPASAHVFSGACSNHIESSGLCRWTGGSQAISWGHGQPVLWLRLLLRRPIIVDRCEPCKQGSRSARSLAPELFRPLSRPANSLCPVFQLPKLRHVLFRLLHSPLLPPPFLVSASVSLYHSLIFSVPLSFLADSQGNGAETSGPEANKPAALVNETKGREERKEERRAERREKRRGNRSLVRSELRRKDRNRKDPHKTARRVTLL